MKNTREARALYLNHIYFFFMWFLFTSGKCFAQFEGEIMMSFNTATNIPNASKGNLKLILSKQGVRIESEMNAELQTGEKRIIRSVVLSAASNPKTLIVLDADQKQYFELDMGSMEEQMEAITGNQDPEDIEAKKLGKEKIGNYETEHLEITNKNSGQVTEMWIAPKLMSYDTFLKTQLGIIRVQMGGFGKAIQKLGIDGFPIKIKNAALTLEVTAIKKGKVSKEKFSIPKGYKQSEANPPVQN
ncbi:MAG: DUF4412 domain-containing protein [Chloroherpetonaceae bacterium]|nr:DUF4412 domain-containing protein [Chloroherpetonaceae bacterium]